MRSYLLKASDAEFDRWREAAGDEPLAKFLRRAANALADGSLLPTMVLVPSGDVEISTVRVKDPFTEALAQTATGRALGLKPSAGFRPDFKGGKQ
jgi:hypothetical protein